VTGPRTFLENQNYRYLKIGAGLLFLSLVAYAFDDPEGGRSGGSWLGYGLGTISALTIFWLMWFGIRKRQYASTGPPLKGWLSAHVYLGGVLLLLVPLHSAFQFGWNVHTLAYVLMSLVIVSGFLGIAFYSLVPMAMTRNRNNTTLEAMLERIAEIDAECRLAADGLPDYYAQSVVISIDQTHIGGGIVKQLSGHDDQCGTSRALNRLRTSDIQLEGDAREQERKLLELVARKQLLLNQIRKDVRYKGLLDLWLVAHVPLAFATCAALLVHVFVVFWYW